MEFPDHQNRMIDTRDVVLHLLYLLFLSFPALYQGTVNQLCHTRSSMLNRKIYLVIYHFTIIFMRLKVESPHFICRLIVDSWMSYVWSIKGVILLNLLLNYYSHIFFLILRPLVTIYKDRCINHYRLTQWLL